MKKFFAKTVILFFILIAIGTVSAAVTVDVSTDLDSYKPGDKITITATVYDGSNPVNNKTVTVSLKFAATNVSYWNSFGNTDSSGTVTWNDATVGEKWYNGTYKITARTTINNKAYYGSTTITVDNPSHIYVKPKPKFPSTRSADSTIEIR